MSNPPQIFTVFGGSFVSEEHDARFTKRPFGPAAAVIAALILGTTISASAVAGLQRQSAQPFAGASFSASQQLGTGFEVALR